MRRPLTTLVFLVLATLLGGSLLASAATPNDTACRKLVSGSVSHEELLAYDACRFDRLDAQIAALQPAPVPTPTPTATVPPKPSATPTPTTTPKPSPTPTTAAGYPTAASTGVPAGTTLTAYTGPATISTAGTVIDGKKITSCLVIEANNVTIKNSLIQSKSCFFNVLSDNGNTGIQLTDVEIDGQGNLSGDSALNGGGYTCLRCDIHGTVDGFKAGTAVTIRDSFIHDLAVGNDSHNDGIQSLGTTSLKILHNRIVIAGQATSAIILTTNAADQIRNVQIDGNLLGGGAWTVYGGVDPGSEKKVSNIAITGNQFTTAIYPKSGAYGPLTSADPPVVAVSGNTWADGPNKGQTVS